MRRLRQHHRRGGFETDESHQETENGSETGWQHLRGQFHKLYVSDERSKAEAIVDVTKDEIIKTLHFGSETGMPQYDPVARKLYVNLQDQYIFAVIDPATDEMVGRYPVGGAREIMA